MIKSERIYEKYLEKMGDIQKTNEYAPGKKYDTDIGLNIKKFIGATYDDEEVPIHEIQDISVDSEQPQGAVNKEVLTIRHIVAEIKGEDTTDYLSKAKSDVYRCIGKHREAICNELNDCSIKFKKNGWEKNIQRDDKIRGDLMLEIIIEYYDYEWEIS